MQQRVIDTVYSETMVLADEARSYFDDDGRADRDALAPMVRVAFSCESLKVTTRLMHVIAWLLTQRAVEAGELTPREAIAPSRRLGAAPESDSAIVALMPAPARALIAASVELHHRVARLDGARAALGPDVESPVRSLHKRLAMAF